MKKDNFEMLNELYDGLRIIDDIFDNFGSNISNKQYQDLYNAQSVIDYLIMKIEISSNY